MGQAQSQHEQARSDELLQQLAGPQAIEYQDIFWKNLFLSMSSTLASSEPSLVEQKLSSVCENLLLNNPSTHNLQVLVLHTVALLHDVKAGKNRRSAANAVRFITAMLRRINRSHSPRQLLASMFEISPSLPIPRELVAAGNHQLLKILVRRLMTTMIEVEASEATYVVVFECACCLLVIASAQIASGPAVGSGGAGGGAGGGRSPAVDALLTQQATSTSFLQRLLHLIMKRPPPPKDGALFLGRSTSMPAPNSMAGLARSAAASLFWLPVTTLSMVASAAGATGPPWPVPPPLSPLADTSLLLLLVLVQTPEHPPAIINPFKWGLASLADASASSLDWGVGTAGVAGSGSRASLDLEGGRAGPSSSAASATTSTVASVRYPALFDCLANLMQAPATPEALEGGVTVGAEEGTLLSYLLLQGCGSFRDYVLSRTDVESVLVPVLHHMYATKPRERPAFAYLLQVCTLLLTQDTLFAANVHRLLLPPSASYWYKEQLLAGGSGGAAGVAGTGAASGPDAVAAAVAAGAMTGPGAVDRRGGGQGGNGVSLGSLLVIVLLRTVATSFGTLQREQAQGGQAGSAGHSSTDSGAGGASPGGVDLALPTNALAALANLGPHMSHLHPHAAQRLLSLTQALAKRYNRLQSRLAAAPAEASALGQAPAAAAPTPLAAAAPSHPAPTPGLAAGDTAAISAELAVVEDYLRIVLEVINAALVGHHTTSHSSIPNPTQATLGTQAAAAGQQLARNSELVYALLHKQDVLIGLKSNPRLADLVPNLLQVIDFFNQRIDSARAAESGSRAGAPGGTLTAPNASGRDGWSVDKVLSLVATSAHYWRPDRLRPFQELKFVYEEEGEASAFFVPYVWGLVRGRAGWLLEGTSVARV